MQIELYFDKCPWAKPNDSWLSDLEQHPWPECNRDTLKYLIKNQLKGSSYKLRQSNAVALYNYKPLPTKIMYETNKPENCSEAL